jgi:hypothetical protein|tara:strand:+ start:31231 stop:31596 length:366 start_codon:yes stop_codon:yes gene_type:complete
MKWLSKIVILFLFCQYLTAQEFITERNYQSKIGSGVVVVEVWAEFNKANEVSWIGDLKDCKVYRIDIQEASSLNIKTVPTVIVYSSGEEDSRFKANIMLELNATKKEVQEVVDKIILSKFE